MSVLDVSQTCSRPPRGRHPVPPSSAAGEFVEALNVLCVLSDLVLGAGVVVPLDVEAGQSLHQARRVVPLHSPVVAAAGLGAADDDDGVSIVNSTDMSGQTDSQTTCLTTYSQLPHSSIGHIKGSTYNDD